MTVLPSPPLPATIGQPGTDLPGTDPLPARHYDGYIDSVAGGVVTGWAADMTGAILDVTLIVDGAEAASAQAYGFRPDLAERGVGTGHHGFQIAIPARFMDGRPHDVAVRIAGTSHVIVPDPPTQVLGQPPDDLSALKQGTAPGKIVFYIEPAIFRRNPTLLGAWAYWSARIAANNPGIAFAMVCSRALRETFSAPANLQVFELDIADTLAAHQFSLAAYVDDVNEPSHPFLAASLLDGLQAVDRTFRPDTVISFTENRYLKRAFPRAGILFVELGSLPRISTRPTLFFDPIGHQDGALNAHCDAILALAPPVDTEETDRLWSLHVTARMHAHPSFQPASDWFHALEGRRKVLLVLQPADHPNYRNPNLFAHPDELVRRVAAQQAAHDPAAVLVPTFHQDDTWPTALKAAIGHDCPNVRWLPDPLQAGFSELMVGMVDEVVTLSSNAAFTAIMDGTCVTPLTTSRFSALAARLRNHPKNSPGHRDARRNLLAFFSNGYLGDLSDLVSVPGTLAAQLADTGHGSRMAAYLDFSRWTPAAIERLLDARGPIDSSICLEPRLTDAAPIVEEPG